jgi:hypothetical protein
MAKILFLNVGWMDNYKGLSGDQIEGGGNFVREFGYGFEIFNFLPFEGRLFGYAETPSIRIQRIDAKPGAPYVSGVLAIWTANNPFYGGTYIVGWYKNATVHRNCVNPEFAKNRLFGEFLDSDIAVIPRNIGKYAEYYVSAAEEDCYLIPTNKRQFQIPRGKGGFGQRNIWYADGPNMGEFIKKVVSYVESEGEQSNLLRKKYGMGGEGVAHRELKEWCANNPQALGLYDVTTPASIEHKFDSGDLADIVFTRQGENYTVVEIETNNPIPGAHQVLKYNTLLCAQKGLPINSKKVTSILVDWSTPSMLKTFCTKYSIRYIEKRI